MILKNTIYLSMKPIKILLGVIFLLVPISNCKTQGDNMILPTKSKISIKGRSGCVASYEYNLELVQDGKDVSLKFYDQNPKNKKDIEESLSLEEFTKFWEQFIALEPLALKNRYDAEHASLGSFSGKLTVEYTLENNTFNKTIVLVGNDKDFTDEKIKEIIRLIENLTRQSSG
jgi:hypothetical protein